MKKDRKYYVNSVNYKIFLIIEYSFKKKLIELILQIKKCRIIKEFLKNHFHYVNKRDREIIIAVKHRRRKIKIEKFLELFIKQEMQNNIKLEIKFFRNEKERFFTLIEAEFKTRVKRKPTFTFVRKTFFLTENSQILNRIQQTQAVIKQKFLKVNVTHKRQMFHFFELSTSAANQAFDVFFNDFLTLINDKFDIRNFTSLDDDFMNIVDFNFNSSSRFLISSITSSQKIEMKSLFLSKSEKSQSFFIAAPVNHDAASNI